MKGISFIIELQLGAQGVRSVEYINVARIKFGLVGE